MIDALARAALDALTAHIAVLDADGRIVAVNEAWKRFARENGGDQTAYYVGSNYLATCESAAGAGDALAHAIGSGIAGMLDGTREGFAVEYALASPAGGLWFLVRFSRFHLDGSTYLVAAHEDITARKQAEDSLRIAERTLRNVLEALPVGVWVMDAEGRIVHGNSAGQRIWAGARYVGPEDFGEYKGWWLDSGKPIAADEWAAARAIRHGETSIDEEVRIQCFDGSSKIILNSGIPLRNEDGRIAGAIIVNQDITARKESEARLRETGANLDTANRELQQVLAREQLFARTDALTGLSNRRHFFEVGEQLFAVAQRYGTPFSVLLFDVDEFKHYNDRYGHQAGDRILYAVAAVAREHMREADVLARYGGEEFIMALPNTDAAGALALADAVRERIAAALVRVNGDDSGVTISAGVADIRPGDESIEHVIRRADQALYEAKDAGRNCCRVSRGAGCPQHS